MTPGPPPELEGYQLDEKSGKSPLIVRVLGWLCLALRLPQVFDATQSCHTLLEHDGVDHVIESGVALPKGLKSRTPITISVKVSSELGYQHDGFTE